ncbi:MAG: UDP-N-acetylmuramoyl-tripeptide--D-alanyl-D-alanine ligase [Candidatus Melainabacteria bacterium]|nr:UDP-N-acetylmuramoyl-tripeptide--D-alanyl-D-alanine ligase [Candidatus Melainabacteria bacterium]
MIKALFTLKEICEGIGFEFEYKKEKKKYSICTNSKEIRSDQIFVPITGEKFDGHDFINEALEKCEYAFCEKNKTIKVNKKYAKKVIKVENTIDAYNKLANIYRNRINAKVIAITGSAGKTTTKELISVVLSEKFNVHKTEKNFNNEIGVPKTILETPEDTEILVLELAMRAKGEIEYLSKTCEPDIAIITNVGSSHIGRLGSLSSIIEAKAEIFKHLRKGGKGFLYKDDGLLSYLKAKNINVDNFIKFDLSDTQIKLIDVLKGSKFKLEGKEYEIKAFGQVHILNSVLAIKVAKYLGMKEDEIQKGLLKFSIPEGRGNIIKLKNDICVIDETYNASPDTVKGAVQNLVEIWKDKGNKNKRILVLGELAELGEEKDKLLKDLGAWLEKQDITVITVGDKLKPIKPNNSAKNIGECCDILDKLLCHDSVVLVKGSRVSGLEKVIEHLRRNSG